MVTKVKPVNKPVRVASTEKPRIQDKLKTLKNSPDLRKVRKGVSDIAPKKVKAAAVNKPAAKQNPVAANSPVKVSRQPVKAKVQARKIARIPVKPDKKTALTKEIKKSFKAQATTATKSSKTVTRRPVVTKTKPVAQRVQKAKTEKKPVIKTRTDRELAVAKPIAKVSEAKALTRTIKPVDKVRKLENTKVAVKAKEQIKKPVAKVTQSVVKPNAAAKSNTLVKDKKKAPLREANNKIAKPEKAAKSVVQPNRIVRNKILTPATVDVRKNVVAASKARPVQSVLPFVIDEEPKTKPEKTAAKAEKTNKKITVLQPVKVIEKPGKKVTSLQLVEAAKKPKAKPEKATITADKPGKKISSSESIKSPDLRIGPGLQIGPDPQIGPVSVKATAAPDSATKPQPAVEPAPAVQSNSKKADKWSDCGQVFFTAGKAYGLTPSLRTICIGNDTDVLDYFNAGTTHSRLNNQQKTVLHNIIENRQSEGKSLEVVIPEPVAEPRRQKQTVLRKSKRESNTAHHQPVMRSRTAAKSRSKFKSRPAMKSRPVVRSKTSIRSRSTVRRAPAVRKPSAVKV